MKTDFFQEGPRLENTFQSDRYLGKFLKQRIPTNSQAAIVSELHHLGDLAAGEMLELSKQTELNPPRLISHDPWGRRIDKIETHPAWTRLAAIAATEGIVANGYERAWGQHSRLVQFSKLYLYHSSSSFFSCPLAMTDGAARALELYGDSKLKSGPLKHLTTRDPNSFWTSGQWMTEKTGGSDVSGTSTIARPQSDGTYALEGTKWFTSATTSQMAMALARIEGHPEGSRGLSLFYLELRDKNSNLNQIEVHRLKDKLGTKSLPTAELTLKGTPAILVGGEGNGVKKIASLFNITRMYNSVCALSATRRALDLAHDYSKKRSAFGAKLIGHPLHCETLAKLEVEFAANFYLTFHLAELLGKDELGLSSPEESAILRMLTPIAKLHTAKSAMAITSEVIEIFGGAGYVEDTGIPQLLRDAQVFSIWEGTTNVLSMDVLRAAQKEDALRPFLASLQERFRKLKGNSSPHISCLGSALQNLAATIQNAQSSPDQSVLSASARNVSFCLAQSLAAILLLEEAERQQCSRLQAIGKRWCLEFLKPLSIVDTDAMNENLQILGSN